MTNLASRRRFIRTTGVLGAAVAAGGLSAPYVARAATSQIRVASNPGLENATLNALMDEQDYFRRFGVDVRLVEISGTRGPFDAIAAGEADLCMVSGYNLVLSRIEQGAKVRIVGAGMRKCALSVYAKSDAILRLTDLEGRSVAVGPAKGLLHTLMLQLLREKGIDVSRVRFVDKGSNDACHTAVINGEADACCSSVSHRYDRDGLHVLQDANLWDALPRCVFQTAYASDAAISDKHDAMVAVMAAYGALYDYLMSPSAHDAFFSARRRAEGSSFDPPSAQAVWDFNQTQRPYSRDLSLTDADIDYLQNMDLGNGLLKRKLPYDAVADRSVSTAAVSLLS